MHWLDIPWSFFFFFFFSPITPLHTMALTHYIHNWLYCSLYICTNAHLTAFIHAFIHSFIHCFIAWSITWHTHPNTMIWYAMNDSHDTLWYHAPMISVQYFHQIGFLILYNDILPRNLPFLMHFLYKLYLFGSLRWFIFCYYTNFSVFCIFVQLVNLPFWYFSQLLCDLITKFLCNNGKHYCFKHLYNGENHYCFIVIINVGVHYWLFVSNKSDTHFRIL